MVKWHHYNVQEAIVKTTLEGEVYWPVTAHFVFWAEHIMILKTTGPSPYETSNELDPLKGLTRLLTRDIE